MLNFYLLEMGLWLEMGLHNIVSMIFQEKCFSFYILLTDQLLLFHCLYFLRNWAICVLQLFVNQAVTS